MSDDNRYDDPKAYLLWQKCQEAKLDLVGNDTVTPKAFWGVFNYIEALEKALLSVNRAACGIRYVGSEYWDEHGAINGTLRAIRNAHEDRDHSWKWFIEEKQKNNRLSQELQDMTEREGNAYERGYADCQKHFNCEGDSIE